MNATGRRGFTPLEAASLYGRRRGPLTGFTLIELLVVIVILAILISLVVVLIAGVIERAKDAKTKAIVDTLSSACQEYFNDNQAFPPQVPAKTKCLFYYLGRPRTVVVSFNKSGTNQVEQKKPYLEFRLDWLKEGTTDQLPAATAGASSDVYDAYEQPIEYQNNHAITPSPPANAKNKRGVDIWSLGADKKDGTGDEITNWSRGY